MARRAKDPRGLEPYILRLQLELPLTRRQAEACARAGFLSHSQIAAAEDEPFRRALDLPGAQADDVLAMARFPGSKAPRAGPTPHLTSQRRAVDVVAQAVRPMREKAAKLARRVEGTATASVPRKPAETAERRTRRAQGEVLEAELDEALTRDG